MKIAWLFLCIIAVVGTDMASRADDEGIRSRPWKTGGVALNEILADPPEGEPGDANRDGVRQTYEDEFVEIYNAGQDTVNLAGWRIGDATSTRHIFPDSADILVPPETFVTIFGGGQPSGFSGGVWVASSGRLALNNDGDRVVLLSAAGDTVDVHEFGSEGGRDESLIRVPDGTGDWTRPSVEEWEWLFSPHEPNRGETATEDATWGQVKSQYRPQG